MPSWLHCLLHRRLLRSVMRWSRSRLRLPIHTWLDFNKNRHLLHQGQPLHGSQSDPLRFQYCIMPGNSYGWEQVEKLLISDGMSLWWINVILRKVGGKSLTRPNRVCWKVNESQSFWYKGGIGLEDPTNTLDPTSTLTHNLPSVCTSQPLPMSHGKQFTLYSQFTGPNGWYLSLLISMLGTGSLTMWAMLDE